jgi:hypothetical protein
MGFQGVGLSNQVPAWKFYKTTRIKEDQFYLIHPFPSVAEAKSQ